MRHPRYWHLECLGEPLHAVEHGDIALSEAEQRALEPWQVGVGEVAAVAVDNVVRKGAEGQSLCKEFCNLVIAKVIAYKLLKLS